MPDPRTIDVHAHFLPPAYLQALAARCRFSRRA
jgi:hypothetical protein